MSDYRIVEYEYPNEKRSWLVQKKSIFGFWYNPDNIDAYTTGWYDSFIDAEKAIRMKLTVISKKVIKTF